MDSQPYRTLAVPRPYESLPSLPVAAVLDNIRSLHNVGAFFRTADAVGLERILLSGYTGGPTEPGAAKVALGAQEVVAWERATDLAERVERLRAHGWEIAAIETTPEAVDLFDWQPRFPVCVLFGNEVDGLSQALIEASDVVVRIPMLGIKRSLNVSVAGGVVLFELLRKFRALQAPAVAEACESRSTLPR